MAEEGLKQKEDAVRDRLIKFRDKHGYSTNRLTSELKRALEKRGRKGALSRESVHRMLIEESVPYVFPMIAGALTELEDEDSRKPLTRSPGSNQLFNFLAEYFDMSDIRAQECQTNFQGTYEFFANSEKRGPLAVRYFVKGAIKLDVMSDGVTLTVTEKQSSALEGEKKAERSKGGRDPSVSVNEETWEGHYFGRKGSLVIVCRSADDCLPKFYVLSRWQPNDPKKPVSEWLGTMVKVGDNGGVFATKIYMRRNPKAFDECGVFRGPLVPISDYLK